MDSSHWGYVAVAAILCLVLTGCGIFDRQEQTLTAAEVADLKAQVGGEVTEANRALVAELERSLGAKVVALEAKVDGTAKVTTASPAEEAATAFEKGYKQGAEMGGSIAPGSGWPSALASLLGGLVVGGGAAASVLLRRQGAKSRQTQGRQLKEA
jgi:hypothetical protein